MRYLLLLSLVAAVVLSTCLAHDLTVGTSYNTRLIFQQKANYMAIPFKKRVKEVFFSDPGLQTIKGVIVRDLDHTENIATITAGGVGSSFANIRLKSARGHSLNYQIEIYV
ncbi:probable salivary secreted peptide [Bicyclus anynana]|uniref:Probable salivary secreted peptide n=1 Tax=Bicyclus anynana TaxID=110368 RepID=A0ABM3LF62_BICAN|nr:probable salivary secreted peptide [Bicyclus anynana]